MYFVFEANKKSGSLLSLSVKMLQGSIYYLVAHVFAEPYVESEFFVPLC